ncbi:MAG: hypothetical protein U9O96_02005 [Candidatus Thermoplasmatota archaeon]|nr:hypothetical protein [Candidatus Thermoplasmatota archaeon]
MKIVSIFPVITVLAVIILFLNVKSLDINESSDNIEMPSNGEWNKIYENFAGEAFGIIKVNGGYAIMGGCMAQNTSWSESDVFLLKIDENGNIIWNKTYGGNGEDVGLSLVKTENGYAICGYTMSYGNGGVDVWIVKTDEQGNELWNKTYGREGDDFGKHIIKTNDGYAIVGSSGNRDGDIWVIRIDEDGNIIWNKTYGGEDYDGGEDILKTEDGYLICGVTASYGKEKSWDAWLIKIDENGNEVWNKTYDYGDMEWATRIIKVGNGYIVCGNTVGAIPSGWLIKVDNQGNEVWNKTYGGGDVERFSDITEIEDGYVLAGCTGTYDVGFTDGWLLKIDKQGNEIWNKSFGRRFGDFIHGCIYDNGTYILAGGSYDVFLENGTAEVDERIWLIKCADYPPPERIKIIRPSNYLYLFDREIMPTGKTLILGSITVIAEVNDSMEDVNRVDFYLASEKMYDYEARAVLYNPPYEWKWNSFSVGLRTPYTITAGAYYGNAGGVIADNKVEVYIVNLTPASSAPTDAGN